MMKDCFIPSVLTGFGLCTGVWLFAYACKKLGVLSIFIDDETTTEEKDSDEDAD